jgi:hypothetical protein
LAGRVLSASGFKRGQGEVLLVVTLADGSRGTIPAAATDVLGGAVGVVVESVLSVDGVRRLRVIVDGLESSGMVPEPACRTQIGSTSPCTRQRTGEVSLLRRLRIAAPVQLPLALPEAGSNPSQRWWSLPDNAQSVVSSLLARMIAASVVEEVNDDERDG